MPCDEFLMSKLHGRLWHMTHPERFLGIMQSGAIVPEPDIDNKVRWKASCGEEFYPYVRFIGGVSLFDFHQFDPESYADDFSLRACHQLSQMTAAARLTAARKFRAVLS